MHDLLRLIRDNWRLLAFGVLTAGLSGYGQTFFISLFGAELRAAHGLSHGEYGLLYSLATGAGGVLLTWSGALVDRLRTGTITIAVTLWLAAGALLLPLAATPLVLALAFFVIRLGGQGMMVHLAVTTVARAFVRYRGRAVSITVLGIPLSEALMPAAAIGAMQWLDWRLIWIAGAALLVGLFLPVQLGLLAGHRDVSEPGGEEGTPGSSRTAATDWNRLQVLADPRFYAILAAILAPPFIVTALFFHQAHIAALRGWDLVWMAPGYTAFATGHVLALGGTGFLVDRIGAARLLPVFLGPMAVAMAVLAVVTSPWGLVAYLGLAGMTMGGFSTLLGALWPELYGLRHLGSIRAMAQAATILSAALAPVSVGYLFDFAVPLEALAIGFAVYLICASLLVAIVCARRAAAARSG